MLSVSSRFTAAERADVNQIASRVYVVLGNYASASAYSATASASTSDGSGNYPAAGAIDGDRTELNVGAATAADNDIGLSSWRSSTAPSVTPQTLTIDMATSRTINRIKLYHLASHGLSSYKLESSPDNVTYTLIAKTTDQGGSIATTSQLDTIDFTDVTCRYVKLTVANTVVAADKANVVELEIYRKVDITDRLIGASIDRARDYKLTNPLASSFHIVCDNSDRFFSFSHTPTTAETTSGFVNSELAPGIGIIIQYGFAYGGASPELVTVFNGSVDRISVNPADRTAQLQGRDTMKALINQIISSKLKTAQDIKAAMTYTLNLVNISTWETSLDTTGLTVDYFFINNQSAMTVIRDLVQASADAQFYFDESGIATFKYYVNSTPGSHTDSSQADFTAGTVKTNIDTDSLPGQIGRKWFLIDDFTDGDFSTNPIWTNRVTTQSFVEDSAAEFAAGTVRTNLSEVAHPDKLERNSFLIDTFDDGSLTSNPPWFPSNGIYGFSSHPPNRWDVDPSTARMRFTAVANELGRCVTASTPVTGKWQTTITWPAATSNTEDYVDIFFIANALDPGDGISGAIGDPQNGYFVRLDRFNHTLADSADTISICRDDGSAVTVLASVNNLSTSFNLGGTQRVTVTRDTDGTITVYLNGTSFAFLTASDSNYSTSVYTGVRAYHTVVGAVYEWDGFFYAQDWTSDAAVNTQAVFESQVLDQSADIKAEGTLTAVIDSLPSGSSVSFFTAASNDGVTFDSYVAVTNGALITSLPKRYIKYKVVLRCQADNGNNVPRVAPVVSSVTITYTVVGWQCVSNAAKYSPATSGITAGLDLPFTAITGTWRANVTMQTGTGAGMAARLYILTTGYDIPTATYVSGYYGQVDQANGKLGIYKINSSGSRTLLAETAQAINTSAHSLRVTRASNGDLKLYWDEVLKVSVNDTGFSSNAALAFEVAPLADTNGYSVIDDVNFSPVVDGTGAIVSSQALFESQVIDLTASISVLGVFRTTTILPAGTSVAFFTATSTDGITFDSYLAVSDGQAIPSAVKRYFKWKAVMTCPIDGGTKGTLTTPYVTDVTINYFLGTGSAKYPTSVSFTFRYSDLLLAITQEYSDNLGGDSSILNDVSVQAKPLILSGTSSDTQWQGTTQTPPVAISGSAPLSVTNGQILTYEVVISGGMDTGSMSGGSPAAAVVTFGGGASGTWAFTRIHPTRPILQITITNTGTITDLRVIGKAFSNSNTIAIQQSTNAASIKLYGDRAISISNQYIVNTGIATTIASKLVANYKNPTSYVPGATVRPTFSAQLNDRVTIVDDNTDLNADYIIAGISHNLASDISAGQCETRLLLLKVSS